jgi:hypothetical protein
MNQVQNSFNYKVDVLSSVAESYKNVGTKLMSREFHKRARNNA